MIKYQNVLESTIRFVLFTFLNPFPADDFSKYKMNVIPNKECIIIIHKFELNCMFRIKSDSSSAEFARYGVIFTNVIPFNSNLCIINMHSLFGITFMLYLRF